MSRLGLRFLVCPDAELLRLHMEQLSLAAGGGYARKVFWGDEDPFPPAYWAELTTQSLFATPTLLILRRAEALKAEVWDTIDAAMRNAASTVWPMFCLEGRWKEDKPPVPVFLPRRGIWKIAEERKWVWSSPGLTQRTLPAFVDDWAAREGLNLGKPARAALLEALPHDAFAAGSELEKVTLAAGESYTVLPEHAQLIAPHGEMEFFEFMKSLANPKAAREVWARVLDDHLRPSDDKILFQLLGYVAWQTRQMWMLLEGEGAKVRMRPSDKPEMARMAQRLGRSGLARIIELTLDANLGVIGGTRRPDDTLELYVAELSALLQGGQQPGARP